MLFSFEDFELDTRQCELRHRGVPRHLEPQVFDVLTYLVQNRDRLVTKQELLETVWGHEFVSESTLSTRLMEARKAVGDNGRDQRIIKTVHGRGFRFVAPARGVDDASNTPATTPPGRPAIEHPSRTPPAPPLRTQLVDAATPLGRDDELGLLEKLLEDALRGARRIAFVTGEAGIGKTTLVDAFIRRAAAESVQWVALGQCVDQRGAGEPYMPVLEALGRCCRQPGAEGLVQLLERRAPTWLAQMPGVLGPERLAELERRIRGTTRERMLREVVEALEAWTSSTPLLLVLEDLHWSDSSTLQLLDWLARRREAARLMVLGTIRTTDLPQEGHALRALLSELQVGGLAMELPLSLLDRAATLGFLRRRLPGAEVDEGVAEAIHRRTEGNPLFIRILLDSWLAEGTISIDEGWWRLEARLDELTGGVPDTLRRLVDQQVDVLDSPQRDLVQTASVAGMEFSAATLALDAPLEAVETRCHLLATEGRFFRAIDVEEWPDGTVATRYAFVHHLQREAIYERVPEGRKARVHRLIALRLEAAYGEEAKRRAGELAGHFLRGRDTERAVRYLRHAAEQCVERAAHQEAVEHLKRALEVLREGIAESDRRATEVRLLHQLASALLTLRGWGADEPLQVLREARAIAEREGEPALLGIILCALATVLEVRGEYSASQQLVEECLRLDHLPDRPVVESHEVLACSLLHQGIFAGALDMADIGSSRFAAVTHPGPEWVGSDGANPGVACHYWAAQSLWFLGRPAESMQRMRASLELAERLDRPHLRIAPEMYAARLHHYRREVGEVIRHAKAASALAREHGYGFHDGMSQILLGWAEAVGGEVERALERVRTGLAIHEAAGAAIDRPYCLGILAEVLCLAGRPEAARDAIMEAMLQVGQHARSFFWEAELQRMLGEIHARLGAPPAEAEARVERALEVAASQGARALELRAAVSLFRLRIARRKEASARQILERVYRTLREKGDSPEAVEAEQLLASLR